MCMSVVEHELKRNKQLVDDLGKKKRNCILLLLFLCGWVLFNNFVHTCSSIKVQCSLKRQLFADTFLKHNFWFAAQYLCVLNLAIYTWK